MLKINLTEILKGRVFINAATCDFNGRPNVAPKFLLKSDDKFIYLVDYVLGMTFSNLKINPRISIAVMNIDNLTGYQINGSVEILEDGPLFDQMLDEVAQKQIELSVERIISGVGKGKKHESFEVALPKRFAVFKVRAEEIVEISSSGRLEREKI